MLTQTQDIFLEVQLFPGKMKIVFVGATTLSQESSVNSSQQACIHGTSWKDSNKHMVDVIKVSARSRSTAVAGAIAGVVREHQRAEIQAIGAGAVNQAIKAAAIARGYLADDGIDVICIPYFTEVTIEDQERTALRLIVEPRIISS
jgi:stage V sporulation protein S